MTTGMLRFAYSANPRRRRKLKAIGDDEVGLLDGIDVARHAGHAVMNA